MELKTILIEGIIIENRIREGVGDTEDIESSLQTKAIGQINTIAVQDLGDGKYKLLAGERRLVALKNSNMKLVGANVYPADLTELDRLQIELFENLHRRNLTWQEEVKLQTKIHEMLSKIHEKKHKEGLTEKGEKVAWGDGRTAQALGITRQGFAANRELASLIEAIPEVAQAKTRNEAQNIGARLAENLIVKEQAKRARERTTVKGGIDAARQVLMSRYVLGDFFYAVKDIESESIDLVEFDPDYNIDFSHGFNAATSDLIQDIILQQYTFYDSTNKDYLDYLEIALQQIYRIMKPNSWLIMWFAQDPWFEVVASLLERFDFKFKRVPGIWNKNVGQDARATGAPDYYLGRTHEAFFYARKGNAIIQRRARADVFNYATPSKAQRIHPTEKPLELMQDILTTFAAPNSKVLVPHAGSGNTILASANLGMSATGYDLSQTYKDAFDVRCTEWEPSDD